MHREFNYDVKPLVR